MTNKQKKALILVLLSLTLIGVSNFYKFQGDLLCSGIGGFVFGYNILNLFVD